MGDLDVERHDGDEKPVCVGQWCCGCRVHPSGKPWGWNNEAWARHYATECLRLLPDRAHSGPSGSSRSSEEGQHD